MKLLKLKLISLETKTSRSEPVVCKLMKNLEEATVELREKVICLFVAILF